MEFMGSGHTVRTGDGTRLHVVEWIPDPSVTERTEVLLVHGLASNAYVWEGVGRRLAAQGHRAVAVDQRGHGRSDKPETGYDFGTLVEDLRTVLVRLGLDRPLVAGQSWGGNVVLELAFHHPDEVTAITGVDGGFIDLASSFPNWESALKALTPGDLDGLTLEDAGAWLRLQHPDWPETGIAGSVENLQVAENGRLERRLPLDRHLEILHQLWNHRPARRFPRLAVPMLLVLATGPGPDAAARAEKVERAAAATDHGRVVLLLGDHDLHAQHPAEVADLIAGTADPGFFE
jgi:pimeloyl-ACP methyl ester carboxylesterase